MNWKINFLGVILLMTAACAKMKSPSDGPVNRDKDAALVYLASDNNLYFYGLDNIRLMEEAYDENSGKQLLVYYDNRKEGYLLRIVGYDFENGKSRSVQIKKYADTPNSCDPAFIRQVLEDAQKYIGTRRITDFVLWSHGNAWMPSGVYTRGAAGPDGAPPVVQYSFGDDRNHETGAREIEIDELADALRPYRFENLYFDACFMGNAETVYQLREAADYIVASPAEILAIGFPYYAVTGLLARQKTDPKEVARAFYAYYAEQELPMNRSATISVVDCDALPELAAAVKTIVGRYGTAIDNDLMRERTTQQYNRTPNNGYLFDLKQYAANVLEEYGAGSEDEWNVFEAAFGKAVVYERHTAAMFEGDPYYCFSTENANGLSVYIPDGEPEKERANAYYRTLDWGRDSGMAGMLE